MNSNKIIRTSVYFKPGQAHELEVLAARLGYLQTRGVGTGQTGSVSQLIQALADDPRGVARRILGITDR